MKEKDYATLAKQAHEAVSAITDPDLKRVAFEKILDDLLKGGTATIDTIAPKPKKSKRKKSANGTTKSNGGPQSQVESLIQEGFFEPPKTISDVKQELAARGFHIPLGTLSKPLQRLCQQKKLRRQKIKGAPDQKQTYRYSKW